jgi:mRNA interferase MazF
VIPAGEGGLIRPSVALCHQVTTLDRAKLVKLLGRLSPLRLQEIANGLKAAMDIE